MFLLKQKADGIFSKLSENISQTPTQPVLLLNQKADGIFSKLSENISQTPTAWVGVKIFGFTEKQKKNIEQGSRGYPGPGGVQGQSPGEGSGGAKSPI